MWKTEIVFGVGVGVGLFWCVEVNKCIVLKPESVPLKFPFYMYGYLCELKAEHMCAVF